MNLDLMADRFKKIQGISAGYFAVLMLVDQYLHINQSVIYVLGVISAFLLVVCTVMGFITFNYLKEKEKNRNQFFNEEHKFKSKHALYFIVFNVVAIYSVYSNCL